MVYVGARAGDLRALAWGAGRYVEAFSQVHKGAGRGWKTQLFSVVGNSHPDRLCRTRASDPRIHQGIGKRIRRKTGFVSLRYHGSFFQISMPEPKEIRTFPLSLALRNDIRRLYFYSNMFEQAEDFYDRHPDECARYGETARCLWKPLFEAVDEIYAVGLKGPQLRARFLMLSILKYPDVWPAFCNEPGWQAVRESPAMADTRFRDICAIMKHYSDRGRGTLKTWW